MDAVHECKKPYLSTECSLKFLFKSASNNHIRCFHEEKKPHKCPLCKLCFKVKGQDHRVHKQLSKSLCTICGKGFRRNQALKIHTQAVHEEKNL